MKKTVHRADSRGFADHGWLKSHHSFSFANYYNPDRMGFGLLRVLNDDWIEGGKGFDTHPHKNMEIVSVPLKGALHHKDSMGNEHIIKKGEIQRMSAGTGITHSEYNHSSTENSNFLQIWVMPDLLNISPSYGQKEFTSIERKNKFQTIVSPDESESTIWINQNAYFSLADLSENHSLTYKVHSSKNGLYLFVISGSIKVSGEILESRDAIGLSETEEIINIKAQKDSELLAIEVPMH